MLFGVIGPRYLARRMKKNHAAGMILLMFLAGCADNTPVSGPYPQKGLASWYSAERTSTGDISSGADFTCAIRTNDFGKFYLVCNTANDKCVQVRHNDFGPAKYLYERGRIIDLSEAAFSRIADLEEGVIEVTVVALFYAQP